ncbi:putative fatty acyl-CoA reductase CG5065 [Ptiloglossa arizonensis]|uniref:putative fatty acyl-CoA reductase CG5065 n=1 Tax=Ptiloglossa arizonensis TaxID=3350558 RepID=UPI003F9ED4E0
MQNTVSTKNVRAHTHSIEEFFAETVVLLTGASGFLGKAILFKLLSTCPRLVTVFILLRSKRGETTDERFKKILADPVFDKLRKEMPEALNKIHYIEGDIGFSKLALSNHDRNMIIQKVNIIFHSAATVKFDEPLKVALNLNTQGTSRIIDLCKEMTQLISFVYISTAYSNANRFEINESIYSTKLKPSTVIELCDNLDDETLAKLQPLILEGHPNTYTFTKNLAEQLISTKGKDLPVAIVRPSIIGAAMKDPYPGWVDNVVGLTGLIRGSMKGIVRYHKCEPRAEADLVPVDYVTDTIICASWHNLTQRNDSIQIYNCTCSQGGLRFQRFLQLVSKASTEVPSESILWYPYVTGGANKFICNLLLYLLHYFPAFMADIFLTILGRKATMLNMIKRVFRYLTSVQYFCLNEWKFHRNNMNDLTKDLKVLKDSNNFITHTNDLKWDVYMRDYVIGIKKCILKEDVTENKAQRRLFILYCLHRITQVSFVVAILAITAKCIGY